MMKASSTFASLSRAMNDASVVFGATYSTEHDWAVNFGYDAVPIKGTSEEISGGVYNPDKAINLENDEEGGKANAGVKKLWEKLKKHISALLVGIGKSGSGHGNTYFSYKAKYKLHAIVAVTLYSDQIETQNRTIGSGDLQMADNEVVGDETVKTSNRVTVDVVKEVIRKGRNSQGVENNERTTEFRQLNNTLSNMATLQQLQTQFECNKEMLMLAPTAELKGHYFEKMRDLTVQIEKHQNTTAASSAPVFHGHATPNTHTSTVGMSSNTSSSSSSAAKSLSSSMGSTSSKSISPSCSSLFTSTPSNNSVSETASTSLSQPHASAHASGTGSSDESSENDEDFQVDHDDTHDGSDNFED